MPRAADGTAYVGRRIKGGNSVRKRSEMFLRRTRPSTEAPNMKSRFNCRLALLALLVCSWCCATAGVKLDELRNDKSKCPYVFPYTQLTPSRWIACHFRDFQPTDRRRVAGQSRCRDKNKNNQ